jgi:hypothetical protein
MCKHKDNPIDAIYCIECGELIHRETIKLTPFPSMDFSHTKIETDYYIYRAELKKLLQETATAVKILNTDYNIYYHGRKVAFID